MRAKRANLNIELDAYNFASAYASAKGVPLGAAISELIRRAESAEEPPSRMLKTNKRGLLIKTKASRAITPQLVAQFAEDDPA